VDSEQKSKANADVAARKAGFQENRSHKTASLTFIRALLSFLPVNSSGQQFARNFTGWYWFTNAADWRLRLQ